MQILSIGGTEYLFIVGRVWDPPFRFDAVFQRIIIIKTNASELREEKKEEETENGKTVLQRNIENWNGITWERARALWKFQQIISFDARATAQDDFACFDME